MLNHAIRPAALVAVFIALQAVLFAVGGMIWPLLAGTLLLLGYLYWPKPEPVASDTALEQQLADTADNITGATSKMAIGAA